MAPRPPATAGRAHEVGLTRLGSRNRAGRGEDAVVPRHGLGLRLGGGRVHVAPSPRIHDAAAATRHAAMAKSNAACSPWRNGARDEGGEEAAPGDHGAVPGRELGQRRGCRGGAAWGCTPRRRRTASTPGAGGPRVGDVGRHALGHQPVVQVARAATDDNPTIMRVKKIPMDSDLRRVLEGGVHARARAPVLGREAVHDAGPVRRAERAHGEAE